MSYSNHRQTAWTREDTLRLVELVEAGKSYREAADELGRSYKSIAKHAEKLQRKAAAAGFTDWQDYVLAQGTERETAGRRSDRPKGSGDIEVDTSIEQHRYFFDGQHYFFTVNSKIYRIPAERMEKICSDYSHHGGDLTQAELARKHGLPIPVMQAILGAYKHFKASLPFTREKVAAAAASGGLDALAEETVEVQEAALQRKIQEAEITRMRHRLRELESEEYHKEKVRAAAATAAENLRLRPMQPKSLSRGKAWQAHIISTDEHAGKGNDPTASYGRTYGTELMARRLMLHADYAAAWIRSEQGFCEVAHRSFLGDIFEAFKGTTVGGTHLKTDLTDPQIWGIVLDAIIYSIDALRTCSRRVVVRLVGGNHDGALVVMLAQALERAYRMAKATDVEIRVVEKPYDHFLIGETLHVLDHGKGYGSLTGWKAKALAESNAREIAGQDFHRAKWIFTYVGHLHEDQVASYGGHHRLIRLPAFCESNEYETGLRLTGEAGFKLYRLDENGWPGGVVDKLFCQIDQDGFLAA